MKAELYWIPGSWPGKLALSSRPRGGDWLNDEISSWQQAGVKTVLSTLTPQEEEELDLTNESTAVQAYGMTFQSLPIPDRQVPPSPGVMQAAISSLEQDLLGGQTVLIHCSDETLRILSTARGVSVPETEEQIRWLNRYSQIICALSP